MFSEAILTMRMMVFLLLFSALPWTLVLAADSQAGQRLHDANCIACHDSLTQGKPERIYTRPERRVKSYSDLLAQVRRCQMSLGLEWSETTLGDVTVFLNEHYYKF